MKKIFVGNFSFNTTEAELRSLFEAHGTVDSTTVVTDRDTGRSRGFAFVEMANNSEADAAILALNGSDSERSQYALYMMNRNGSGRQKMFPNGQENGLKVVDLAWSPDADQLLAVRDGDLWLFDLGQRTYLQLTANGDSHLPRWK